MGKSTAITRVGDKVFTLEDLLKKSHGEIAKALPMQMSVNRLVRVAISSVRKNPDLQMCDALSIVACVIQGAQLGLEMDGVLGNAYMVPYGQQAQFIIGYKGLVTLGYRSDRISRIDGKNVYEGDDFEYQYGTNQFISHIPRGEYDPDKITDTYVIIKLADGRDIIEVWGVNRIKARRDRFSQGWQKKPNTSPWAFAFEAMALKTVARAAFKFAPISVSLQNAIAMDEQYEVGIPQGLTSDLADSLIPEAEQVADKSQVLNRNDVMQAGNHKGVAWRDLPIGYVNWLVKNMKDKAIKSFAEQELAARENNLIAANGDDGGAESKQEEPAQPEGPLTAKQKAEKDLRALAEHPQLTQEEQAEILQSLDGQKWTKGQIDGKIVIVKELIEKREGKATGQESFA